MKTVTFTVEITTELFDDVDPENVHFDIDCGVIEPRVGLYGRVAGKTTGYRTVDMYGFDEQK